jgi:pilus assembly protein CpaB
MTNPMQDPRARASRFGALGFTLCAVALAGATGWLLLRLLNAGGYGNEPTRPVVVAAREVQAGRPLRAQDLRTIQWPASSVPAGAFGTAEQLLKPEPRVPTGGLTEGEPVLRERLAEPKAGPGLAALVSPNARAVAVKVDREVAAAHLLYPGAHVDVLTTLRDPIGRIVSTRTVIENVRVLAIGTFADIEAARRGHEQPGNQSGSTGFSQAQNDAEAVVTLEVSPHDAEKLTLSAREGKIDLALRNAADEHPAGTGGVTSGELLAGTAEAPANAQAAPLPVQFPTPLPRHSTSNKSNIKISRAPASESGSSNNSIEVVNGSAR